MAFPRMTAAGQLKNAPTVPGDSLRTGLGMNLPPLGGEAIPDDGSSLTTARKALLPRPLFYCANFPGKIGEPLPGFQSLIAFGQVPRRTVYKFLTVRSRAGKGRAGAFWPHSTHRHPMLTAVHPCLLSMLADCAVSTAGVPSRLEIVPGKIPGTLDSKSHELRAAKDAAEPA